MSVLIKATEFSTRMDVTLGDPYLPGSAHGESSAVAPVAARYDGPINILIVDDEPKNLTVLETVLDDPSYRLVRAASSDQALLALINGEFALIILDIRMPGITGLELAVIIKERKKTALVPIIFLTAYYSEDQHILEGYGTGAVDYLHKPVNPSILRSKVAVFAELHRRNREVDLANRALFAEAIEHRRAAEQLRELNETLDQRVLERTEALRANEAELREAKDVAESASRVKSDFLASMSHEIRTPMNAILGSADLLAKTPLSPEQHKYVQIFRRAGDRLLHLVNDILDLSKVEALQLELEHTRFSLKEVVDQVAEMLTDRARERGLSLVCDIEPNVPTNLIGDPTRLRQVLLNLMGNGIKFTEAGEVSLRVTQVGADEVPTALRFSISDTGIGIPGEEIERIFERFTQADSSTTRRFGGSGLGLTISKRLVELMGGRIWVESTVEKGSVFSFAVPFEICAGWRLDVGGLSDAAPKSVLPTLRILMAEDSPDNCTIALAYLAETPYRVEIAETGAIACEMFFNRRYDLVLMDRQMPVMDGLTATRTIRAWEQAHDRPPTPIIALTASALKGDREKCLAAGCTAFLTKPIKQDVLLQAIEDYSGAERPNSVDYSKIWRGVKSLNSPVAHSATRPMPTPESTRKDPSLVVAHPQLAAQIPAFLQNRRKDVITMTDALARSDFETVKRLGHSMKGAGVSFGFQTITDIGAAIEIEAGGADIDASRRWVGELTAFLDRVDREDLGYGANDTPEVATAASIKGKRTAVHPRRIVLVEDDDDLRVSIREILEHWGHHVTEARDGIEGLARILADRPDFAIVDIGLPGLKGYEVARRARAALGHSVQLVAMTGYTREKDRQEALVAGFDTHMAKPLDFEILEHVLENQPGVSVRDITLPVLTTGLT